MLSTIHCSFISPPIYFSIQLIFIEHIMLCTECSVVNQTGTDPDPAAGRCTVKEKCLIFKNFLPRDVLQRDVTVNVKMKEKNIVQPNSEHLPPCRYRCPVKHRTNRIYCPPSRSNSSSSPLLRRLQWGGSRGKTRCLL